MRVVVGKRCEAPCPSCSVCDAAFRAPSVDEANARVGEAPDVVLGGGDASRWEGLERFVASAPGRRVEVEAPLESLRRDGAPERLAGLGVRGVRPSIDVTRLQAERTSDDALLRILAGCERLGLVVSPRLAARPVAFARMAAVASLVAPRPTRLEWVRQDVGGRPVPLPAGTLADALRLPSTFLAGDRRRDAGYLPPCALPELHAERPDAWREVLADRPDRNAVVSSCASCPHASRCHFSDAGALGQVAAPERRGAAAARKTVRDIRCMEPWLKMELTDPRGLVHQCCADWTVGPRGDRRASTLRDIWNGPGYRAARRAMREGAHQELCRPLCPRLHDGAQGSSRFVVVPGSPAFVRNQEAMLEDLASGRDELRSLPLHLALCPSTTCNFDCIMCDHGRTPRRDLPDEVWEELPELLPTLSTLVLLGGEPLASPRTLSFLRAFDPERWPDTGISLTTNGSLLRRALPQLTRVPFVSILVSVNAGTAETYEAVQRGIPFDALLDNLDALVEFRRASGRPRDLRTGFVVQPANAHTLVAFGELTAARGLGIRLLPLHENGGHALGYYGDPDQVARVLESVDGFARWASARRPEWATEIQAVRSAIVAEAESRRVRRLPLAGAGGAL